MPTSKSNLSLPDLNFDFVVGVTQEAINATMLAFLDSIAHPVAQMCWVLELDESTQLGVPVAIEVEELIERTGGDDGGVNPFTIEADVDAKTDPRIEKLDKAGFLYGFRGRLGVPPMSDPRQTPDMVEIGDSTRAVVFNMLCSEFTVVELSAYRNLPLKWTRTSQKIDQPWIFRSDVNLDLQNDQGGIADLPKDVNLDLQNDQGGIADLPKDVRDAIINLGNDSFSIGQLLFDLTTAKLLTVPTIEDIPPGSEAVVALNNNVMRRHFLTLQAKGQPLLGVVVQRKPIGDSLPPTLSLTNFNFHVNPYLDGEGKKKTDASKEERALATLNYVCVSNRLLPRIPDKTYFPWNWCDYGEAKTHHGVLSIRRETLAQFFSGTLLESAKKCCAKPWASASLDVLVPVYRVGFIAGQQPTMTYPPTGSTVLDFSYSGVDESTSNLSIAKLKATSDYKMKVDFIGDRIVISQALKFTITAESYSMKRPYTVVDRTMTDTFYLAIANDQLEFRNVHQEEISPKEAPLLSPSDGFLMDAFIAAKDAAKMFVREYFATPPIAATNTYVFPGGNTFSYQQASFSDYQDLTLLITYLDPMANAAALHTIAPPPVVQDFWHRVDKSAKERKKARSRRVKGDHTHSSRLTNSTKDY